jgi:hypothetical protein
MRPQGALRFTQRLLGFGRDRRGLVELAAMDGADGVAGGADGASTRGQALFPRRVRGIEGSAGGTRECLELVAEAGGRQKV